MANFEALIRGAITVKHATTPAARMEIYRSSRHALYRLIEENRNLTVEAAIHEKKALETAISTIEAEFITPDEIACTSPPTEQSAPTTPEAVFDTRAETGSATGFNPESAISPDTQHFQADPENSDPLAELFTILKEENISPDAPPQITQPQPVPPIHRNSGNIPPEFSRRRKNQRLFAWLLAILTVLAWLTYYVYDGVVSGTIFQTDGSVSLQNTDFPSDQTTAAKYITILEPGDLSTLVTAGRGKAEIVNENGLETIRLVSIRSTPNADEPSKPILIRLKPGVLEQISGKNTTFEIYAKSATSSHVQFTIKCQFGALGSCGRKRFRVGEQPEASIFAVDFATVPNSNLKAYIAINTNMREGGEMIRRGAYLDIVYIRLRTND